uniref:hypothetical chloroplast RF19 n=1 Tax=Micranthes atrata TaxID=489505 RepID=UPI0022FD42D8|nr:hypothetical chloroplast RF19 [Micranthes atrata]WBQ53202.1 hypothetical chloroplast RF19 [Micranthes atrata]
MILKSFLLGNLVSLCMKIINSVVVVGLYYGFLTTFSIAPSYLFLLRAQVMEEGTQKKVSATTGFITGQLMMFISIYYAPLHLALGRPHTITVLALPYLLFHFFWNNHKHFFYYGSTTRNSMRNLSIQCVFLNNLIFQLFNYFILPSSMLARLVNIYMFRCNNKMLFVTSSFIGWLIGHILFMKWVGLVLVWIRQNNSIRSNVLIRSNKYLVSEARNSMARIFSILLFITCVYYLGRIPSPIVTNKLKETSETEERGESEEETDVEIETTSETKGTKEEQGGSTEEDPSPSLFSEEKEDPDKIDETEEIRVNGTEKTKDEFHFHLKETCYKNSPVYETFDLDGNQENSKLEIFKNKEKEDPFFWFEKPLVTRLFDYKRWTRPLWHIKNDRFENAVRNEMSQYFFDACRSDGKQRISFTYPPSLSIFREKMQRHLSLYTTENSSSYELYNQWVYTNEQNENNLSNEFISRIEALDKRSLPLNFFEKRTRLCNDETKKEYLPKKYDPLLNGPYRRTIHLLFSPSMIKKTSIKNSTGTLWINKIHGILLTTDYREFKQKIDAFDKKSLSIEIGNFLNLISEFAGESPSDFNFNLKGLSLFPEPEKKRIYSKDQAKFLFNAILTLTNDQRIRKNDLGIGIKEISKKISRWSYKLIDDLEQEERENQEDVGDQIRSRKGKRVVIFTANQQNPNTYITTTDTKNSDQADINNSDQAEEVALIRYSHQSDFRRDIIKGSMRAQRRKVGIWELFQANAHSPLFLDRIEKSLLFSFDISKLMKLIFINQMGKNTEFQISNYAEENTKEKDKKEANKRAKDKIEEKARIKIAEIWDTILFAQVIRGSILVTQSILRKYIILPSFIIAKNMGRMLLFQFPEWSEDLKGWKREMHVKCTYNGVPLSETEFPKNWLTDGIQIKILFPFCLKPWHRSKSASPYRDLMKNKGKNFCFLTVWGMEAELPFCSPRKGPSFFEPIFKKLIKKMRKFKTIRARKLIVLNLKERINLFLIVSKEKNKWIIKSILFIERIRKELSKRNPILLFGLREAKKEKDLVITNSMIYESSSQIKSIDWTNYSLTEKKIKDLTDKTSLIRTQIVKMTKEKKKKFLAPLINISANKKSNDAKILESPRLFRQMLKRINIELICKSYIKFFLERIYINIFLCMINIPRISTHPFLESLESKKKTKDKYISKIEANQNQEGINKTNKNLIHFIKSLSNISNSQNLSSLSQAYIFYKLSQTQVTKFKYVLQYHGTSHFLKNKIKNYCGAQGIFHSEFKYNKFRNSGMNQWKNWLRGHYPYTFYKIRWSRLVTKKQRNRVNQGWLAPNSNKDLNKWNSYEKNQVIHYEKENNDYTLLNQKSNFKKHYGYDLLSYKSMNYEDKKNSYIYVSPLQVKTNQGISYNYNTHKHKLFDGMRGSLINNFLVKDGIMDMEKNRDRKFLDWQIVYFCLKKKVNIESWININSTKNAKTSNDQKIDKKDLFYLTIHQEINPSTKKGFDWMGMNEERPIWNLELWFFPEFVLLYGSYKIKPWVIPMKLLLFNGNISANKDINEKKKDFELENRKKKESPTQGNLGSVLSTQEKNVEEDEDYAAGSDIQKHRNKKHYKNNTEAEVDLFFKNYLLFQLRWDDSLNQRMINNIKVYCLLLRLINPREIAISSIQRGEISLDIILIEKDFTLTELMKKGIFIIEPVRLSVKNNGQFIMYQTISISLIHKSKDQTNKRSQEKVYVDKKDFDKSTETHQKITGNKITGNREKNYYSLLISENILSPRRRREFRILICFNSRNRDGWDRNPVFCDGTNVKNCGKFLEKNRNIDIQKNKLIKLKFFLLPTYRLEDLACMNRYWFDTINGSRFSMVRIDIYPQLN